MRKEIEQRIEILVGEYAAATVGMVFLKESTIEIRNAAPRLNLCHIPFNFVLIASNYCIVLLYLQQTFLGVRVEHSEEQRLEHTVEEIVFMVGVLQQMQHKLAVSTHPSFALQEMQEHQSAHHLLHIVAHSLGSGFLVGISRGKGSVE